MKFSEEAGFVNDGHPGVAAANGHVGGQHGPGVGLGVVHLHAGQVAGPVVAPYDVQYAAVGDHPGVTTTVVHVRYRRPLVGVGVVTLDTLPHQRTIVTSDTVEEAMEDTDTSATSSSGHV